MNFAITNQSTRVTNDQCEKMAAAIQIQMAVQMAPVFGWYPDTVKFYADPKEIPAGSVVFHLKDAIEDPNALGFHTEGVDGSYWSDIAINPVLDNGGGVLDGGQSGYSVASVLSHEAGEARADLTVNVWADGPSIPEGSSYAYEIADPVEGDSYNILLPDGTEVLVSNWVGPRYFDMMAPAGSFLDWCGKAKHPFEKVANGYFVVRAEPGSEQEVFGETMPPDWRMAMKRRPQSRTARRMNEVTQLTA